MRHLENTRSLSFFQFLLLTAAVLALSILLFTLSQPNLFVVTGVPVCAYIAYIPVFLLVRIVPWKTVWLYGLLYGIGAYCLFTYWLATFHPMGILVISFLYGLQLMLVFPLLKAAAVFFKKTGWLVQWIVWCGYEYLKTQGFAGVHYGVTAYSHWNVPLLRQCADIGGVWLLSALIVFVSAWISGCIAAAFEAHAAHTAKSACACIAAAAKKQLAPLCVWGAVFACACVYGAAAQRDYSSYEQLHVALIQQNSDPWKGGISAYRRDLQTLMRLSDEALAHAPETQLVVWPETAFIPRITWHYRLRTDRDRFELVEKLLAYLDAQDVPFVIGNDHAEEGYLRNGEYGAVDYNSVLVFKPKENVIPPRPDIYKKMHLVPFTEYFPFEKQFPGIYELLLNGDTHMWEPGTEPVVFSLGSAQFSTPICFEDTFGYIARRFVNAGANAIVNLSNDAWSKSLACQYQHLSMAVFRSVENRVPSVRATASGQTCIIDPNGAVTAMADPFKETYVTGSIPIRFIEEKTLYTRYGDIVGVVFAAAAAVSLIAGSIAQIVRRVHGR